MQYNAKYDRKHSFIIYPKKFKMNLKLNANKTIKELPENMNKCFRFRGLWKNNTENINCKEKKKNK